MKNSTKKLSFLLAGLGLLLAACGSSETSTDSTADSSTGTSEEGKHLK